MKNKAAAYACRGKKLPLRVNLNLDASYNTLIKNCRAAEKTDAVNTRICPWRTVSGRRDFCGAFPNKDGG